MTIHFEDSGYGDAIVLVHGHATDNRVWDDLTATLANARYRVVRPDLRGHGTSEAPETGYRYEDHVADLTALIGHIGVGPVHLVGHSLGGGIALLYALEYPTRVRSLVLISPTLPGYSYSDEFSTFTEHLRVAARNQGPRAMIEQVYLPHPLFDGIRSQPERFDKLRSIMLDYKAPDYLSNDPPSAPPQASEGLERIAAPTLIVSGENDPEDFRLIADILATSIPNAEKQTLPEAGHIAPMEQPDEVQRLLADFFKRVGR